jgi:hypothetical protein
VQIHLPDDDALALRLIALRLGMPAESVAQAALRDFLTRHSGG